MKRTTFRIKIWVSLAVACGSLALVSSASARLYTGDLNDPPARTPQAPVSTPSGGFSWADAAIGAAVGLTTVD